MAGSIRIVADYEIVARLGKGGMGNVYKAIHRESGVPAAIKILSADMAKNEKFINRFLREAHAATILNHKNIVGIYEAGEHCGLYYIALEFIDGETLANALEREGRFSPVVALQILAQVADGLAYAHQRGIIHRDIKPGNIMITRDGVAKITDMGLVKLTRERFHDPTRPGYTVGTPAYMSPEQVMSPDRLSAASDIYSLGATIYHLIVGYPPHIGKNSEEVMTKVYKEEVRYPETVPPEVVALLKKMLAKNPKKRFRTASEVADEARRLLKRMGAPIPPPPRRRAKAKKRPSSRLRRQVTRVGSRDDLKRRQKRRKIRFPILILTVVASTSLMSGDNGVRKLLSDLSSDFYTDRCRAKRALIEKGKTVESALVDFLKNCDDERALSSTVEVLSRLRSKKALPQLLAMLDYPDTSPLLTFKKTLKEALMRYEPPDFAPLIADYKNLNESRKRFIVQFLRKVLSYKDVKRFSAELEAPLLPLLEVEDVDAVAAAALLLARLQSEKAFPLLFEMLDDENEDLRKAAQEALSFYEPRHFSNILKDYNALSETKKKVVTAVVKKMLVLHISKQFFGSTWIFYPGQFDKFKPIRKVTGVALRQLLEEWLSMEERRWSTAEMSIAIFAAGDLKLQETKDVLKRIFDKEPFQRHKEDAAIALALMGEKERFTSVVERYERNLQTTTDASERMNTYLALAHLYHQVRDYKKAEEFYKKAIESAGEGIFSSSLRYNYACLLSVSGRPKEALEQLRKALSEDRGTDRKWLLHDGELKAVRELPEFKKLAEEYGLIEKEKEEKEEDPE